MIDHLVIAATDLGWLCDWWEEQSGVAATPGGAHDGWGTRNALVGLGPTTYVELIGPDPEQDDFTGTRPFGINDLAPMSAEFVTFAVAVADLDRSVAAVAEHGLDPGPVRSMSRVRPDGVRLNWRLATPPPQPGGVQPFLIEWAVDAPHPAAGLTQPWVLDDLVVAGAPVAVVALLADLNVPVGVQTAPQPSLRATVRGPNGVLHLP